MEQESMGSAVKAGSAGLGSECTTCGGYMHPYLVLAAPDSREAVKVIRICRECLERRVKGGFPYDG